MEELFCDPLPDLFEDACTLESDLLRDEWIQAIVDEEMRATPPVEEDVAPQLVAPPVQRRAEEEYEACVRSDDEELFTARLPSIMTPLRTRRWWGEMKAPLRLCERRLRRLRAKGGSGPRCRNLEHRAMQYVRAIVRHSLGDDVSEARQLFSDPTMIRMRQLWIVELTVRVANEKRKRGLLSANPCTNKTRS